MAYQNINQYVYNKWYLKPLQEVSDISLTSDERQYNEEVVFSPNLIGEFNGNVMPIKIDLNFSGSNQGFVLNYQDYNQENILVSANYYNLFDDDLNCFSSKTICDIGLTGTDNGLLECMSGQSIEYTMGLLPDSHKFDRYKYDRRFKMFQVTGHTWSPNHRFSGLSEGIDYSIVSVNSNTVGIYDELYGGFYQGFYKLFGYDYEILPTRYPKGWTVEMTLKPRLEDAYLPPSGQTTLNDFYPDNAGIFFYMGTRAENKFWHDANGKNQGDPNYQRVTESLTGLSSCMCEILNSGYTTTSYTNIPIRVSGATIVVEPNLLWMAGDTVLVYHDVLQYIEGIVESYNTVSGELKFVSTKNVGTGNFPYWRVDKPNYLEYAESYCVKVYPETGYTSGNSITYCSCCVPPPPKPKPEHNPLFDSMSNALAIKFSGDPANPKICVRTLTFTGDCVTTGYCETTGFESQTGYSINNYCSTRGIYDDCLATDYFSTEHWVLIDAVFERYTWMDFCDLYYRGGLGVISNLVYTATTANNSVSLIQPPLTHNQTIPVQEELVELNYDWLLEEFYRRGKLKLYVNGRHFETFDNFEEIIPRGLYGHKETQVGVPFNISWGGGTQGLHENLIFSAIPQTFCGEYIQDPELFPDNILSGTSLSGLSTNIILEKYFAGTFDGGISTFHMYAKPLSVPEIQHNARILYDEYNLLNPYCLDCEVVDTDDFTYEFVPEPFPSQTPTETPTQTPTPTISETPTQTPTETPTQTPTPTISETPTQTPTETPTQTPTPTPTPTIPLCNRLVNSSFDIFMSDLGPCPPECTGPPSGSGAITVDGTNCTASLTYNFYPEDCIPGWDTTHSSNIIEIWASGYRGVPAYEGSHFAEINAQSSAPQSLYQTFTASNGTDYQIQFAHRGRIGYLNTLRVGLSGETSGLVFFPDEYTGSTTVWTLNAINFTATEVNYNLVFSATSGQDGGNFLDAIYVVCDQEFITPTPTETPTQTPTVTPTLTPTLTPSPSGLPSLCLVVQVFETPTIYLPVLGLINSKPYFEYTQPQFGRVFKIYWDGTQWVTLDIYENFICSTMNYSGLYPDTNFAPWIQFTPPEPPYDTCAWVGSTTYPAPCSTPPNTPTPSVTVNCCETYNIQLFEQGDRPCVNGNTITYLDCNDVWQTILLPPNATTTLCVKYGPSFNLVRISGDCEESDVRLGNCDCGDL
jgi:hypothetical protein